MSVRIHKLWGLLFLLLLVQACTGNGQNTAIPQTGPSPAATPASTNTPAETPTSIPEDGFQNPVLNTNFPDPFILVEGDRYYGYATNGSGRNVQMAVSDDLVTWELLTDAMPALPQWTRLGSPDVWAPEVMKVGEQYILYFTARDEESGRQCIGVAISDKPEGKYRDPNPEPLICQVELGGSIDAHPFRYNDSLYLYWKNDGNCCGRTTWIYVQEMTPDGLGLVGEPVQLVSNDEVWEGSVVEAPTMVEREGSFYLFYSANGYGGPQYAVGYAVCQSPVGPCEDAPENPILSSLLENPPVIGPGHQTIVTVDGQDWLVYHAWEVTTQGLKTDRRFMWIDKLDWEDGNPVARGPTRGMQPEPID